MHAARPQGAAPQFSDDSVAISLGLERAFHRHADVVCLFLAELGQLHAQLLEVQRCDLFVQLSLEGYYVHGLFRVLIAGGPQYTLDRSNIRIVATACHHDVILTDDERIGRVEVDPSAFQSTP